MREPRQWSRHSRRIRLVNPSVGVQGSRVNILIILAWLHPLREMLGPLVARIFPIRSRNSTLGVPTASSARYPLFSWIAMGRSFLSAENTRTTCVSRGIASNSFTETINKTQLRANKLTSSICVHSSQLCTPFVDKSLESRIGNLKLFT